MQRFYFYSAFLRLCVYNVRRKVLEVQVALVCYLRFFTQFVDALVGIA